MAGLRGAGPGGKTPRPGGKTPGGKAPGTKKGGKGKKGVYPYPSSQYVTVIINRQCAYDLLVALTQALGTPVTPKKGKKKKGGKGKGKGKGKGGKKGK